MVTLLLCVDNHGARYTLRDPLQSHSIQIQAVAHFQVFWQRLQRHGFGGCRCHRWGWQQYVLGLGLALDDRDGRGGQAPLTISLFDQVAAGEAGDPLELGAALEVEQRFDQATGVAMRAGDEVQLAFGDRGGLCGHGRAPCG